MNDWNIILMKNQIKANILLTASMGVHALTGRRVEDNPPFSRSVLVTHSWPKHREYGGRNILIEMWNIELLEYYFSEKSNHY